MTSVLLREPVRIDRIEAFPLACPLNRSEWHGSAKGLTRVRSSTLVRVTTGDGVCGWGECFGDPLASAALVRAMAGDLRGRPLDTLAHLTLVLLERTYHTSLAGAHAAAISGIDIAMWDAWARTLGLSVSSLLGSRVRDRVPTYASTGYMTVDNDEEAYERSLQAAVDRGFRAAKIRLGSRPENNAHRIRAAKMELGPDGRLLVDYNATLHPDQALREMRALEEHDVIWAEEPLPPWDEAGWRRLRAGTSVSLATGEALSSRFRFAELLSRAVADVVQPDLTLCGGITEAWAVCQLAIAHNTRVSPHVWGTGIGQAASLQLLAALPEIPVGSESSGWFEWDAGPNPLRDGLLAEPVCLVDGLAAVPTGPGLGVAPDEEAIAEYAAPD